MASRYWVGGTGNWSDAANHWSDTSGGTPGAGFLPTSADDVYFDANSFASSGIVDTLGEVSCKNMDWSAITQSVMFRNIAANGSYTGYNINIYGSLALSSLMTVICGTRGFIYFLSSGSETITSNGLEMSLPAVYFDGAGGKWTLIDDFYVSSNQTSTNGIFNLANGEFDLNGKILTCRSVQILNGTKTITFGSGKIITNNFSNYYTGLTINPGTGTLQLGPYYRTSLTGSSDITIYNLEIYGSAQASYNASPEFQMTINATVTNSLILKGEGQGAGRLFISPGLNSTTTKRSFTAESVTVEYSDFYDIIGLGNADWDLSSIPGGAGDGGGNENIIFTTPKTIYWYANSGDFSDVTKWFTATGGGGTSNQFPMIQDVLMFDENSFSEDSTIVWDITSFGNIDAVNVEHDITFADSGLYLRAYRCFGSILLNSLCIIYPGVYTLHGGGNYDIDLQSNVVSNISIISRGMWILQNNLMVSSVFYIRNGNVDMNYYDLQVPSLYVTSGTMYVRTGTVTLAGSATTSFQNGSGTFDGSDGTLINNPSAGTSNTSMYIRSGINIKNVQFKGFSTGRVELRMTGTTSAYCIFQNVMIDAGRKLAVQQGQEIRVQTFNATGTEENIIYLFAYVSSGSVTLPFQLLNQSYNDIVVEYCDIAWSEASGTLKIKTFEGKTWSAIKSGIGVLKSGIKKILGVYVNSAWIARNSTDSGNNTGWEFNA